MSIKLWLVRVGAALALLVASSAFAAPPPGPPPGQKGGGGTQDVPEFAASAVGLALAVCGGALIVMHGRRKRNG